MEVEVPMNVYRQTSKPTGIRKQIGARQALVYSTEKTVQMVKAVLRR